MPTKSLKKYNDSKLTSRQIAEIIAEVTRKGRVDSWSISMIYGGTYGLFDDGILTEKDGFVVLVEVEEVEPAKPTVDEQIEQLKATGDSAYIQAANLYSDCLNGGDWLEQLVREDELLIEQQRAEQEAFEMALAEAGEILLIEGLKLKNLNKKQNYWFFVGSFEQCERGQAALLHDHLAYSTLKQNGKSGNCWMLIVDRIYKGFIQTAHIGQAISSAA